MIYFVFDPKTNLVKIGTSKDVNGRVEDLRKNYGHQLELMFVMQGGHREEALLHNSFKDLSVGGEWFKWTDEFEEYRGCAVPAPQMQRISIIVSMEDFQLLEHLAASKTRTLRSLVKGILAETLNALSEEEKDDLRTEKYRERYNSLISNLGNRGTDRSNSGIHHRTSQVSGRVGEEVSGGSGAEMERENGVCRESDSGIAHTYRTTAEPEGRGEDVSNPTENWKFLPLGIGLEPKVIQQVTDLANETGKSRSEMIRELINEALDARMKAAK